jgi:tetratricopeptide (TPR) repeat protein
VFGMFEPPRGTHYFLGAGLGPVTVDELMAEHHIEVVNLAGKGGDDVAERSVIDWLETLRDQCREKGITLHQARPDADDLDGWLAQIADNPLEARDAIDLIERRARDGKDHERVVEVLLGRFEQTEDSIERSTLLREVAGVYETGLGDLRRAFEALTTACALDPASEVAVTEAERLAAATGGWTDLVAEASQIATDVTDPLIQSAWWARLGRWYGEKLDRYDYATPSIKRALELDPTNRVAHAGMTELLRRQGKWAELADALRAHVEVEQFTANKVDLLLALGDLCESQLAATGKAIEAYQAAADLDVGNDDALAALERLYRRDERWGNLAKVLERRAELCEDEGDTGRSAAIRRELATLRADKLGDLEGAIQRYEGAIAQNATDVVALKALQDLYDKTGRIDDYLRTLERLAQVAPEGEKLATLRKLAAELEDRDGAADRARKTYEAILDVDPVADDAYRGLERLLRNQSQWYDLVAIYERHIAAAKTGAQRLELYLEAGMVNEKELADPHKAIECHLNAIAIDEGNRIALTSLARLYQRTEHWERAAETLVRHAALDGERGAGLYAEAGRLALEQLLDPELASRHFEKALSLDSEHLAALRGLADLHEKRMAWTSAVDALLRAEQLSGNRLERVELIWRAGEMYESKIEDAAKALDLFERVLKLDPDHVDAGEKVADRLIANGRWDEALPVLEMLARRSEGQDRLERARREAQLGKAYAALHRNEKAAKSYKLAVEADPDNLEAALGLAQVLMAEAKAVEGAEAAAEQWKEVDRRYREVLARHRTGLADGQVAEIWYRLGLCSRALGDDRKAEVSYRRALEKDPLHEATLAGLVDLAGQRGDWRTVVEVKRSQIEVSPEPIKLKLLDEIGDLWRNKLKDVGNAVGAYLEGLALQPGSHVLLHKLLDAYTEQRQWRRAVETLDQLAEGESSADRRSRYHYAAAVIARDELKDLDLAVDKFSATLDDVPATPRAFEGLERALTDKKDWKNVARAYRKQLKRLGEDGEVARLLELWTKLGDVCLDHLGDQEAAIAAFQVACELAPDDIARHEQLADLYIEAGDSRRGEAIGELQLLLAHAPERVELYKALANLYREEHELDKAWCVAQALVFLGAASEQERGFYDRHRPLTFVPASRRLTEELWQKAIIHPREDRHVGAIFATTLGALAGTTAQPPNAFGLDMAARVDLDRDGRPVTRVVKYATSVLALDPMPMVWLQDGGDGLRVANTLGTGAERGRLVPSLLVGAPQLAKNDERELAFEVGKRLAYLRPERFATLALGTLPKLEGAFAAAISASGARLLSHDGSAFEPTNDESRKLAIALKTQVPGAMLEQVGDLGSKLSGRVGNGLITGWRSATDHTANRVGFILSNDLETAAKMIATENSALSTLPVKERLRELLAFSVSEGYFSVRRHLGLHIREEASA